MRFHSAAVIRLADAKPVQLGHTIKADGRWRLFVFAAAESVAPASSFTALCQFLASLDNLLSEDTRRKGQISTP